MRFYKPVSAALVGLLSVTSVFADLSPAMKEWSSSAAQHLLTKDEIKAWKSVRTDADAQAFIDLFWARRDPTPETPRNEYREEFDARVKFADEKFSYSRVKGSTTDRGKVLVLFGAPTKVARVTAQGPSGVTDNSATSLGSGGSDDRAVTDRWVYAGEQTPKYLGVQSLEIDFTDPFGSGQFRMGRSPQVNLTQALQKASDVAITSPMLKQIPTYGPKPVVATAPPAPAAVPQTTALRTDELRSAITQLKAAAASPYSNIYADFGEFVTTTGEYFVPVQLYFPKASGLAKDTPAVIFGLVENGQGETVLSFEEPATVTATVTGDAVYSDKSLVLPSGEYTAYIGLASNGKPLGIVKQPMKLTSLDKEGRGVSRLILSNSVGPMPVAQKPTDPFAFGGIKVTPKGDRTFTKADELWYFFELRNPGVDEAGAPKIQLKIDMEGALKDKKVVKRSLPLSDTETIALKGVPGHFGVGSAIPLATFQPGTYKMKIKVIDSVTKDAYTMEDSFTVGE